MHKSNRILESFAYAVQDPAPLLGGVAPSDTRLDNGVFYDYALRLVRG